MRRAVLLLLLLLWSGVPLQGQEPIPVNVQLTPREITVGDRVSAELTLVWDGEAPTDAPRFPTWQEAWGKAEILEISEVEAYDDPEGRQVYTQTLVLTAFETGEISLPPMRVAVPLAESTVEVPTRAAAFAVTSVLPPAPESEGAAPDAAGEEIAPRPPAPLRELEIIERNISDSPKSGVTRSAPEAPVPTRPRRVRNRPKSYARVDAGGVSSLGEFRESGAQPFLVPSTVYDATARVLDSLDRSEDAPSILAQVREGLDADVPEYLVRTCIRFWRSLKDPIVKKQGTKYGKVDGIDFYGAACHAFDRLGERRL